MKKVLILGVNGFIGHHLSKRILETTDWHVYGMDMMTDRITDILEMLRGKDGDGDARSSGGGRGRGRGSGSRRVAASTLDLPRDELGRLILSLTDEMHDASRDLRFEEAARLRDEINDLKRELRDVG